MDFKIESVIEWYSSTNAKTGAQNPHSLTKSVNQSRQGGGLLSPARVIKEESGERLAPIVQHADERATREMLTDLVLSHESEANAVKGGTDHNLHVIHDERTVDRNG